MSHLPISIEKCPIKEAVFEIRYSSEYPPDAIFGILYDSIKDFFSDTPISLPILQLPETVRNQDPNFRYHPYHRLTIENMTLSIGPRVLTFVNSEPYSGWKEWSKFFYAIFDKIEKTKILSQVERIGLRYINIFEGSIFDKVKFEVKVNNKFLREESTSLRTEFIDDDFIKILQIGNSVNIAQADTNLNGSLIDIDCLYNIKKSEDFFSRYYEIIESAHIKEKELFFSILENSFIDELIPDYGVEK